jgi:hypothetical protein
MYSFFERDRNGLSGSQLGGISGCGLSAGWNDGRRHDEENVCAGQQNDETASATRTGCPLHNLIQDTMPKLKVSLRLSPWEMSQEYKFIYASGIPGFPNVF